MILSLILRLVFILSTYLEDFALPGGVSFLFHHGESNKAKRVSYDVSYHFPPVI